MTGACWSPAVTRTSRQWDGSRLSRCIANLVRCRSFIGGRYDSNRLALQRGWRWVMGRDRINHDQLVERIYDLADTPRGWVEILDVATRGLSAEKGHVFLMG